MLLHRVRVRKVQVLVTSVWIHFDYWFKVNFYSCEYCVSYLGYFVIKRVQMMGYYEY